MNRSLEPEEIGGLISQSTESDLRFRGPSFPLTAPVLGCLRATGGVLPIGCPKLSACYSVSSCYRLVEEGMHPLCL